MLLPELGLVFCLCVVARVEPWSSGWPVFDLGLTVRARVSDSLGFFLLFLSYFELLYLRAYGVAVRKAPPLGFFGATQRPL